MMGAVIVALAAVAVASEPWAAMRGAAVAERSARSYTPGQVLVPMYVHSLLEDAIVELASVDSAMLSRARLTRGGAASSGACGLGTPIEIYLWPDDRLPVERVFPRERWGERIVGMYVPGPVDRIALIAWASPRETYRILVHELDHAWYERSCAERVLAESSESFAQAIDQLALRGWDIAHADDAPSRVAQAPPPAPSAPVSSGATLVRAAPTILVAAPVVLEVTATVQIAAPAIATIVAIDAPADP